MPRKRRIRPFRLIFLVVFVAIVLTVIGFFYSLQPVNAGKQVLFTVKDGETTSEVTNNLEKKGLIHYSKFAYLYARLMDQTTFYAGQYQLNDAMSVDEILTYLNDVNNSTKEQKKVTVVPGMWAKELAVSIHKQFPNLSVDDIVAKWNSQAYIKTLAKDYPYLSQTKEGVMVRLEGFFLPETYYISPKANIDTITRTLLNGFLEYANQMEDKVSASGLTTYEWVTRASILIQESSNEKDMKLIAGIIQNRLDKDMALGMSTTIQYILQERKDWKKIETSTDIDSPYNTYKHKGLPIGPIANPTKKALEAVLSPTKSDYLYFVADINGDGSIYYAKTLDEQEKNMKQLNLVVESN